MIGSNYPFLTNELYDVVRLFGRDAEVEHVLLYEDGVFHNSFVVDGQRFSVDDELQCEGELSFKRYAKRYAKLALYRHLSRTYGEMPWGALTGIRPTKLAYTERREGRAFEPLFRQMGVREDNIALVREILSRQKEIYENNQGGLDLFVGIPFCPTKCAYCSFITADIRYTEKYLDDYLTVLEKELAGARHLMKNVKSVYVGGGTPFVLDERRLERLLKAIAECSLSGEYTVEAGRPDVFTRGKLDLLRDYGVNRICINAQTFSDETLVKIGRKHTANDVFDAFELASGYPFDVNLDLIAGLEGEDERDFARSLQSAIACNPDNITVHTLCLKKGAKLKEETDRLEGDVIDEMIACSRELLPKAGYAPYYLYRQKLMAGNRENVGWTKIGKACVYNVDVMEEITDNLAVGANAISKKLCDGGRIERYASPKDIPTYLAKIEEIIEKKDALFAEKTNRG